MKVRTLLVLTAFVASILGAIIVYLALSVPNDLRADALLKQARQDIAAGKSDGARTSLARIVQQYPRTDAAAAATVALITLSDSERQKLARELAASRRTQDQQARQFAELTRTVTQLRNAPPPKPQIIVQAPPPRSAPPIVVRKAPARKAPVRKAPAKKKAPTRRRR